MGRGGVAAGSAEVGLLLLVTVLPVAYFAGLISLCRLPRQSLFFLLAALILWGFVLARRGGEPYSSRSFWLSQCTPSPPFVPGQGR